MVKKHLPIILSFIFLAIVITFPAILSLQSKMIGDMGDGYQFIGFQYIAKKLFFEGNFPFGWTNFWRYPYGIEFQNIYDSSLLIIFGLAFYQFASNPILVYNLSVLAFIVLSLGLTYFSFSIFFSPIVAFIGAIIYGLAFSSIARLGGHINLFLIPSFLFFFTSIYQVYKEHGSKKSFILFSLASILIPFSSLQFPLILIGGSPFIVLLAYIFFKNEVKGFFHILWQKRVYLFVSLLAVITVFGLFHGQKLFALLKNEVQMPVAEISSVPIVNFIFPNSYLRTLSATIANNTKEWIEYVSFIGYAEMVLFALALTRLKFGKKEYFFFSVFIIFFILSLGQQDFLKNLWPYQYLFPFFPYRGIIEPGRFAAISMIAFTALVLIYLSRIKNKKILVLIAAVLILERLPLNFQLSPSLYDKSFNDALKKTTSKAVLHLPLYVDWWNGQYYDMYSVYSDKPMVNGYVQWSGNTAESQILTKYMEEYTCYYEPQYAPRDFDIANALNKKDRVIRTLIEYDIRTVVINHDLFLNEDNCFRARPYIEVLLSDTDRWEKLYDDGKKEILRLKK